MNRPLQRKTKMKRVSSKRAAQKRQYAKARWLFLERPENRICPVVAAGFVGRNWTWIDPGSAIYTSQVHHRAGCENGLLLDERFWMAVSAAGHAWIGEHANEARERGWILDDHQVVSLRSETAASEGGLNASVSAPKVRLAAG